MIIAKYYNAKIKNTRIFTLTEDDFRDKIRVDVKIPFVNVFNFINDILKYMKKQKLHIINQNKEFKQQRKSDENENPFICSKHIV